MRNYPAIIEKDANSDYGISFPDFPGCVSAGATAEEAIAMGGEALAGHIAIMAKDGDPIPDPTRLEAVDLDPEVRVVCLTLIPAIIPGKVVRINVTLDEALLEEIDTIARNRSGFLADAAREKLARRAAS